MSTPAEDARYIVENYFNDPVGYVRDVLKAEPDEWQADALNVVAGNQRLAVASGHGIGKTWFIAWLIHLYIAT